MQICAEGPNIKVSSTQSTQQKTKYWTLNNSRMLGFYLPEFGQVISVCISAFIWLHWGRHFHVHKWDSPIQLEHSVFLCKLKFLPFIPQTALSYSFCLTLTMLFIHKESQALQKRSPWFIFLHAVFLSLASCIFLSMHHKIYKPDTVEMYLFY